MAFNRSARFLSSVEQTPPVVGPATYEPLDLLKKSRDPEGMYAFLSSATRNTLSVTKDAICFPGPGAYDVKEFQKHIPGGCSIDFTDRRSRDQVQDGPGPGNYRLPEDMFKRSPPKQRTNPEACQGAPGALYLGPPPRSIMASAVSVPTHRDTNGYDVNEFGCLVKNLPDENEPSLFYDIPREESNFTTRTYKGNFWSRMTGRDDNTRVSCGPGPGTYDLKQPENPGKLLAEKLRESRRKSSKQTRYIEAVFTKNLREGHPAPNAYAVPKSPFDTKEVSCECQEYIFKPPPFGQGAKRFVNVIDENPAPGSYNPVKRKCCPGSIIAAPFGSLGSRFKSVDGTVTPGPGEYFSPKDGLAYEACKKCRRNCVKVGFNSSVSRNSALVGSDGPGPDKYSTVMNKKVPRKPVHHSVFKSTTKRFKRIPEESVPPNAYDVTTAYKACHEPCEFLKCPEDAPFNSKQIRMPQVPDWVDINVPGPGLTNMRGDMSKNVKGGSIARGRRFRKAVTETGPGPQDYCLHPYSASSILQRHFNVTLGKPKVLRDLQPPEIPWSGCSEGEGVDWGNLINKKRTRERDSVGPGTADNVSQELLNMGCDSPRDTAYGHDPPLAAGEDAHCASSRKKALDQYWTKVEVSDTYPSSQPDSC